ncbi:hypothetical protein [Aggregatibacter aphrophilus]|uniref:hypothetical protein n=1 Tax=Aggregatibacter aphrophilus TaxID=732 RepID=UPI0028E1D5DE|nr:hypothetical protein [Aggregatibacter aphrophilus]
MANLKEQEKWEDGVYQIEENDPVLGGENGITNKPIKQLANRTLWLKKALELFGKKSAPKDLTADSTSTADESGHSHKLPVGSITQKGIWQATSDTGIDSDGLVLTAKAGKKLAQLIAQLQLNVTQNYINNNKKSDAVNSNSSENVASSKAVKTAYDKGLEAKTAADNANQNAEGRVPKTGDTTINGTLRAKNISGGWSAYQFETSQGYWQLEVHPNSHEEANRRFNMMFIPNIGNRVYLSFPTLGNDGEVVAYQSWAVNKAGDSMTGILRTVGIASTHFGAGAYSNQYTSGAPFMVEATGSKDRDTYHPFVKGLVRSKGRYGAGFSLGYTTKQGNGDGFGRGIINLVEDNGTSKNWGFEHNGDFYSAGDVRTSSGKSLNTAAQLSDFQYQKIGDFEIRRYPDGMMIQTYFTEFNDVHASSLGFGGTGQKQLTWAVSFVGKPMVFGNITTSLNDHHDVGVNILTKSTNTTLYWYNYEHSNPNQGLCRLQFLAIGRWK